ncbi:hypothetical protein HHI36_020900 [Cryptolaemus montrouzieri]|uniref:Aminopeptidase n=1 Tax=Cryptolaemus montrouzieri TaxID=559131 RepID=A0ABD2NC28_9CUCU
MLLFRCSRQVSITVKHKSHCFCVNFHRKNSSSVFSSISNVFGCNRLVEVPLALAPLRSALRSPLSTERSRFQHYSVAVSVGRNKAYSRKQPRYRYSCSELTQSRYTSASGKSEMCDKKTFQRLPTSVRPKHYDLTLVPDLKKLIFQGDVSIEIEVKEPITEIVLNAMNLYLKNVDIEGAGGSQTTEKVDMFPEEEIAKLIFANTLQPGQYKLKIVFQGTLNDKMKGFYRSKYTSPSGEERYGAVTQFEPTDARQCFPCWDEPALKATFNITLTVPKDLTALSNMPVKSTTENKETMTYVFDKSPIMSTYLVAAVVGEYDFIEDKSADGVLVRVYTPKGKKEQGRFALEVATKVLPYYKYYFNIAYPLPKMDLIAIADFSAGAMENWGLVTYRETCLLVDPENTPAIRRQWIAIVVSHELAHQWFGNLVTMEWWTHLWLNEGYAQFTEFLCVDHLFPNYDIWKQFVSETYTKALELDGLKNSHPIEVPVQHPNEIDEIFDDISYSKGASVIRMLHHYIGEEDFRKGMNLYLTRHQYKNTFTEDLWAALQDASQKPVGEVMSTWTKQMGFPEVKVSITKSKDGKGATLHMNQSKFSSDGSVHEGNYLWMIPISVSTSKNPSKEAASTVLKAKEGELFIPDIDPETDWVKVNPGTIGYYRTHYSQDMLERLTPALKNQTLPPLDRLGIIDDMFALVQAGHASTVQILKLLQAFEDETDYTVWSSICGILSRVSVLLSHTDCEEAFQVYQRNLLRKISKRLGWDPQPDETHLDTLLRGLIAGRLAWLDDEETTAEAKKRFAAHVSSGPKISADLRSACYRTVLRAGGEREFTTLLKLYREADMHEEKDRISRSLGAAKDSNLLAKVLDFAMSNEVRSQDTVFVIMSVAITRVGRDLAWNFYKDNWRKFVDRYDGGGLLTRLIKFTTENYASEKMAHEVETFFKEHKAPGTERSVQQAVETIRLNALWLNRDSDAIKNYLSS